MCAGIEKNKKTTKMKKSCNFFSLRFFLFTVFFLMWFLAQPAVVSREAIHPTRLTSKIMLFFPIPIPFAATFKGVFIPYVNYILSGNLVRQ